MGVKMRKKNGKWYVFVNWHGKRKAKCVGSREAAELVKRKIEARLALGEFNLETGEPAVTLAVYADRWLRDYAAVECKPSTVGFYGQYLRLYVLPQFGGLSLEAISREKVKEFVARLCARGLSKNTVRLAISALRVVLSAAIEDGVIPQNPAAKLGRFVRTEKPEQEATALTPEQVHRLLETAKEFCPAYYPMILTAVRAG